MEGVYIIGIDLAKQSFQLHGARADGTVAFRKKLGRAGVLGFLSRGVVAMGHARGRTTEQNEVPAGLREALRSATRAEYLSGLRARRKGAADPGDAVFAGGAAYRPAPVKGP